MQKDESRLARPVEQRLEVDGEDKISILPHGSVKEKAGKSTKSNVETEGLSNREK